MSNHTGCIVVYKEELQIGLYVGGHGECKGNSDNSGDLTATKDWTGVVSQEDTGLFIIIFRHPCHERLFRREAAFSRKDSTGFTTNNYPPTRGRILAYYQYCTASAYIVASVFPVRHPVIQKVCRVPRIVIQSTLMKGSRIFHQVPQRNHKV